jgi:uncharacterized membrane protein
MVNKENSMLDHDLEARISELEHATGRLGRVTLRLDTRVLALEAARRSPVPAGAAPALRQPGGTVTGASEPARRPPPAPWGVDRVGPPAPEFAVPRSALAAPVPETAEPGVSRGARPAAPRPTPAIPLSDLFGRRILGWIGGAAILIGVALFLALAIARGWIGPEGRVVLAGSTSVLLMAIGVWLYERHGRTEAAAIAVAVATAGQWATIVVAVDAYRLLAPVPGVLIALATATLASLLAVRWAGRPIAAIGLIGGLLSPLALGVADHTAAIAIVGVAAAGVVAVTTWQRWGWVTVGALAACAPQWAVWLGHAPPVGLRLAVLTWFTAIGLVAAVLGSRRDTDAPVSAGVLAGVTAALAAAAGALALRWGGGDAIVAGTWLAGVGAAYAACGRGGLRRLRVSEPLAALMTGLAVALGDGALALVLSGLWLTFAWGASALACAWLVRRGSEGPLAELGLGAQVGLTLIRALQASAGSGHGDLVAIVSVSVLAATCLAGAVTTRGRDDRWSMVLHGVGLLATAYLTMDTLTGPALVAAWCGEAAVLAELSRRTGDRFAGAAAFAFLGLGLLHAMVFEAPPTGLLLGTPDLWDAAIALGVIALVLLRAGLAETETKARVPLLVGALATLLYLGSVALITAFQPTGGAGWETVLDLGVRQQGQVLLSGAWSLVGVFTLVVGLRANHAALRAVGLAVLLVAVAKVFLYDLSTLTSIYRVLSLVGIGVLCLGAAFAYQRVRPGPRPDLRAAAPVER